MSLDADRDTVVTFFGDHATPWAHGHLGDWSETDVPQQFNVSAIPATFLIDPGGNIVVRDLRGDLLHEAVKEALGEQ